jgi:hypothetical protein
MELTTRKAAFVLDEMRSVENSETRRPTERQMAKTIRRELETRLQGQPEENQNPSRCPAPGAD